MLKVGIVALGRWGKRLVDSVQGDGIAPSSLIRFTKAHTRTPAKAQDFMAARGLAHAATYEALLADPQIDAVVLASPHSEHARQVKLAAAAGKAVYCEKPFTLRRSEAADAVEACRKAGVKLAVGFNRRFQPGYLQLKQLLSSGALGTPLHVEGNFSGSFGFGYTSEAWHANPEETPAGGLTLMGIHVIDAMIGLLGPIDAVSALSLRQVLKVPLDDTTGGTLRFRSGQSGYVSTLTATARQFRLQLYGTKGWAHMLDHHILEVGLVGEPVTRQEFAVVDAERLELEAFARFVRQDEPYPVPLDEVVNGVAALEAFVLSSKSNSSWQKTA
jgi:predicted dehydrogenase